MSPVSLVSPFPAEMPVVLGLSIVEMLRNSIQPQVEPTQSDSAVAVVLSVVQGTLIPNLGTSAPAGGPPVVQGTRIPVANGIVPSSHRGFQLITYLILSKMR